MKKENFIKYIFALSVIIVGIISSCKKENPVTAPAPIYLKAEGGKQRVFIDDAGPLASECRPSSYTCSLELSSVTEYNNYDLAINELKGEMIAEMKGNDTVKITKTFSNTNLSQELFKNWSSRSIITWQDTLTENPNTIQRLYNNFGIKGFTDTLLIMPGELVQQTANNLRNNEFIYIDYLYVAKNGFTRREIVFKSK